jgi:carboxylate-amine ligase
VAPSGNLIPDAEAIRRAFATPGPPTVGIEEEVMLLDPATLDLLPRAADVVARAGCPGVKGELPASQIELATGAHSTVGEAAAALRALRAAAAEAAGGIGLLAASGAHPFSAIEGAVSGDPRYEAMVREYAGIARRQLVFGLHVHVAIRPAERALAVHNALRSYLPELAALAANAPFHGATDTGLASIRPKLSENLPRQGVPPALPTVEALAAELGWAGRAGVVISARQWWWELRLHPWFGTVEVRVCDAQPTVGETAARAALVQALCVRLAERADAGDLPDPAPTWRIDENRWSACRHGIDGSMADLDSGRPVPTRDRLSSLLEELEPTASRLGCATELRANAEALVAPAPGRYRAMADERGLRGLVACLAEHFRM